MQHGNEGQKPTNSCKSLPGSQGPFLGTSLDVQHTASIPSAGRGPDQVAGADGPLKLAVAPIDMPCMNYWQELAQGSAAMEEGTGDLSSSEADAEARTRNCQAGHPWALHVRLLRESAGMGSGCDRPSGNFGAAPLRDLDLEGHALVTYTHVLHRTTGK